MVFNSPEFLVFAVVALGGHSLLSRRAQRVWLVLASYIFYGWAEPWHCLLLAASTVLDFNVGLALARTRSPTRRRMWLLLSLAGNLGLLSTVKYAAFVASSLNHGLWLLGQQPIIPVPTIPLPIGISFYTFQTLSYSIDVYRRKIEPTPNFTTFALFVAFFPQLVAGPIERAGHLLAQLEAAVSRRIEDVVMGAARILWGLTKKIVFADWLALYVDTVFDAGATASNYEIALAAYAFAFQIYLDFSAYSDIAIGLARFMGIELRENFRWPYLSRNIAEFWRRWHISLSSWLRDYLYFSLGGSRMGTWRTAVNVTVVMFLGGLWHGANWTFVVWGLWLGMGLAVFHTYAALRARTPGETEFHPRDVPKILLTFHFVLVSWVFFRAQSLEQAFQLLRGLAFEPWGEPRFTVTPIRDAQITLLVLAIALLAHLARGLEVTRPLQRVRSPFALGLFFATLIATMVVAHAPDSPRFIYFQF